jgi:hypothetical protein
MDENTNVLDNTLVRMAERVTRLETNQESVQRDTAAIRTTQHAINNELQRLVAADYRMAAAIEALTRDQASATEISKQMAQSIQSLTETVRLFVDMKTDLITVIKQEHRRSFARQALTRFGAFVAATATAVAGIATVIYYIMKP